MTESASGSDDRASASGRRAGRILGACLLPLLAVGCGENADSGGEEATEARSCAEIVNFEPDSLGTTETGLRTLDLREGRGTPATGGDTLVVHYVGCLTDGTLFDSSYERGTPFGAERPFVLGSGQVIPGWDEGLVGMRPEGRRLLVIPPDLAYGRSGAGDVIPPNSTLVFRVELLGIGTLPSDSAATVEGVGRKGA